MQQTPKAQWKELYSAFRWARKEYSAQREDGLTVFPEPSVAAMHAVATAVADGEVRADFALRHAAKLPRVWHDAWVKPRAMSPKLKVRLAWARYWPKELPTSSFDWSVP
jgi:hypothetical protein